MPSRRGVLAGLAGATPLAVAGCSQRVSEPDVNRWLHTPDAVVPVAEWGFATLEAGALDSNREALPASWEDALGAIGDAVDAISVSDLDRVALQAGTAGPTRAAGSAVLTGGFDASAVGRDLRERYDGMQRAGSVAGNPVYGYAPAVLQDLQELDPVDADEPVDATAGLAVGDRRLVVGAAVAPRSSGVPTGVAAVRAAVRAGRGDGARLPSVDDDAALALETFGVADAVVGARLDYDARLAPVLASHERRLLRGLRLAALGVTFDGTTSALLAYGDDRRVRLADLRDVLRSLEAESGLEVTAVQPRQGGRAFVVATESDVAELWGLLTGS